MASDTDTPGERFGDLVHQDVVHRIKQHRHARDWSQRDLADELAKRTGQPWSQPTIARLESGDRGLNVSELAAFAEAFGVSPTELLSGSAPESDYMRRIQARRNDLQSRITSLTAQVYREQAILEELESARQSAGAALRSSMSNLEQLHHDLVRLDRLAESASELEDALGDAID